MGCPRRRPWTKLRTPVCSYPIDVFQLSFNFLCLLLLYSIYLNGYYLFLCPDLYPGEAAFEPQPPLVGAVVDPAQVRHDRVEGPHVHKVEQLREQLDGQGRVHTTLPADQFKSRVTKIFPGNNFQETQVSTKKLEKFDTI
jgi:hypothetical protein